MDVSGVVSRRRRGWPPAFGPCLEDLTGRCSQMVGRVNEREEFISFAPGRRGKRSILDCILTVLSHRTPDGTWPILTFRELRDKVSALRKAEVADASIRSVVYRAGLFEHGPGQTVRWRLNVAGREVARGTSKTEGNVLRPQNLRQE